MKFSKIKHGIPIPDPKHGRGNAKGTVRGGPSLRSVLSELEIGDSFTVSEVDIRSLRSNIISSSKSLDIKTTTRWNEHKGQMNVWRIS